MNAFGGYVQTLDQLYRDVTRRGPAGGIPAAGTAALDGEAGAGRPGDRPRLAHPRGGGGSAPLGPGPPGRDAGGEVEGSRRPRYSWMGASRQGGGAHMSSRFCRTCCEGGTVTAGGVIASGRGRASRRPSSSASSIGGQTSMFSSWSLS